MNSSFDGGGEGSSALFMKLNCNVNFSMCAVKFENCTLHSSLHNVCSEICTLHTALLTIQSVQCSVQPEYYLSCYLPPGIWEIVSLLIQRLLFCNVSHLSYLLILIFDKKVFMWCFYVTYPPHTYSTIL